MSESKTYSNFNFYTISRKLSEIIISLTQDFIIQMSKSLTNSEIIYKEILNLFEKNELKSKKELEIITILNHLNKKSIAIIKDFTTQFSLWKKNFIDSIETFKFIEEKNRIINCKSNDNSNYNISSNVNIINKSINITQENRMILPSYINNSTCLNLMNNIIYNNMKNNMKDYDPNKPSFRTEEKNITTKVNFLNTFNKECTLVGVDDGHKDNNYNINVNIKTNCPSGDNNFNFLLNNNISKSISEYIKKNF